MAMVETESRLSIGSGGRKMVGERELMSCVRSSFIFFFHIFLSFFFFEIARADSYCRFLISLPFWPFWL